MQKPMGTYLPALKDSRIAVAVYAGLLHATEGRIIVLNFAAKCLSEDDSTIDVSPLLDTPQTCQSLNLKHNTSSPKLIGRGATPSMQVGSKAAISIPAHAPNKLVHGTIFCAVFSGFPAEGIPGASQSAPAMHGEM